MGGTQSVGGVREYDLDMVELKKTQNSNVIPIGLVCLEEWNRLRVCLFFIAGRAFFHMF